MELLGRRVCQAACALSILMTISATFTIVAGFINMGTFHATYVSTTVGIWCGLCMFLQVFLGLLLMGTRQYYVGALYFLISLACIVVAACGIFFSKVYLDEFNLFVDYNKQLQVKGKSTFCDFRTDQCRCFWDGIYQEFKDEFQFMNCPLIHFGQNLWEGMMALVCFDMVFSLIGTIIGFWAIFSSTQKDDRVRHTYSFER